VVRSSGAPSLLDDFENGAIPSTGGWESYFQDDTDTELKCVQDGGLSHGGSASLQFEFDVAPDSWATCGFFFDAIQDWQSAEGVAFFLRADRADLPFDVDLYGGTPGGRTTYIHRSQTPAESVEGWTLVQIRWEDILRAEWEENPGTPFNPAEVTGFALGLSTSGQARLNGTLWVDDLSLLGMEAGAVSPSESEQPGVPEQSEQPRRPLLPCPGAFVLPLSVIAGLALSRRKREERTA
jgi:hypothetical protein